MCATLCKMGCGPSFIRWVDPFYTNVQSAFSVNGYQSSFFSLSRGVRQGCALFPLLYVLVSEVLAANIHAVPHTPGLSLPGAQRPLSPISQYADDTSLIVSSDTAIHAVFDIYALFEKGSGAKINMTKSKGLWLGAWSGRLDPPVALDWTSDKIKVLGVFLGPGNLEEENWRPRISAVENVLASSRQRSLSYGDKALIMSALALSWVRYVPSLIHMPPWVHSELNKLAFSFFWKGKRDLISRYIVVQPCTAGGCSAQGPIPAGSVGPILRFFSVLLGLSFLTGVHAFLMSLHFMFCPNPSLFRPGSLLLFYSGLLLAWREIEGSFSERHSSLVMGSLSPFHVTPVSSMSAKSCYQFLLSEHRSTPHCEDKFRPMYGDLY